MELRFAKDLPAVIRSELGYATALDALGDPRGWTVRCTPRRRTIAGPRVGGHLLFRKERAGPGAAAEWRMLHELEQRGFGVPTPVCWAQAEGRSVVVSLEVAGRPLDALLREAVHDGSQAAAAAYCSEVVAPLVRRLHDSGLFHRDLYWNHLYAESLTGSEPRLIDVERVFRPRWRIARWRIKDLAALLSSTPPEFSRTAQLRFLRSYLTGVSRSWRELAPHILRKAHRIASRRPKYG